LLRLGIFIYDHVGGRISLPPAKTVDLKTDPAGLPLKPHYTFGFEYSDCVVDDSRLVIVNAMDARARGASMNPRTRCLSAERTDRHWLLTVEPADEAVRRRISARVLINAAGPWVSEVSRDVIHDRTARKVRLDKGSHIVLPRIFDHGRAYIFQNADGRILFAIPYQQDFTLIGTTEQDYCGDPADAQIDQYEVDYLCSSASNYFRVPVERDAIVWTYSGVRALYDDGTSKAQEVGRDYVLELDAPPDSAPLLILYGGKLTTYRGLAEAALSRVASYLPMGSPWTARAILPGGDAPAEGMAAVARELQRSYPFIARTHIDRLVRAYGTQAALILQGARSAKDLGQPFAGDLTEAEIRYLVTYEWARTAADVLWRRSKLGLRFNAADVRQVESWMASVHPPSETPPNDLGHIDNAGETARY
jgi:glycerol-3-phosphate dehydrogenase